MDRIIRELSQHAAIEEQIFYPAARRALRNGEDLVLEALEEHHVVKWTLSELDDLDPENERFEPKAKVLFESVRHHVEEDETELFPKLRKAMSEEQLDALGTAIAKLKRLASTRPHQRAPDWPPPASCSLRSPKPWIWRRMRSGAPGGGGERLPQGAVGLATHG